jgi:hypothetical protein
MRRNYQLLIAFYIHCVMLDTLYMLTNSVFTILVKDGSLPIFKDEKTQLREIKNLPKVTQPVG